MLGFIPAPMGQKVPGQYPNQIQYSYGGDGHYLCPPDPRFNQHGEIGMYYDTPLGGPQIPTDAELATVYGRTPVASAWITAKEGYFPSPWRPPGGWNPAGAWGPQPSLGAAPMIFYKFGMSPLLWGLVAGAGGLLWWMTHKTKPRRRR
jgi:hypothetical protein